MKPTVLIIEDEPSVADTLVYALSTEGFEPCWKQTLAEAQTYLQEHPHTAAIILDIGLPDGNGLDFCKTIRRDTDIPILFLTARSEEIDRILGLELGGDDYVTKPFSPREVTARIKAILRRQTPSSNHSTETATTGSFHKDDTRREIQYHGTRLSLTLYEYRLLETMLNRPGRVFSRESLMQLSWDDPESSMDRVIDSHIKSIRAKLRKIAPEADPIKTHRGFGYSLVIS